MAHSNSGFSEASDLLAAALEQMDGILASNYQESNVNGNLNESETLEFPPSAIGSRSNGLVGSVGSGKHLFRSDSSSTTSSGLPSPKTMSAFNPVNAYKGKNSVSTPPGTPPTPRTSLETAAVSGRMAPQSSQARILRLTEELRLALEGSENAEEIRSQVPESTLNRVSRWMIGNNNNNEDLGSSPNLSTASSSSRGRSSATGNLIRKLENDKESLSLQVSVLTDQLDAQLDKIKEFELQLQSKEKELEAAEMRAKDKASFQRNGPTAAAAAKDATELATLKSKINSLEKEKINLELKLTATQADSAKNQQKLSEKDLEITDLKLKMKNNNNNNSGGKSPSATGSASTLNSDFEAEKLRKIVESLLKSGKEKDRTIDDLRDTLNRFKRIQDLVLDAHESRKKLDTESDFEDSQSLASGVHFHGNNNDTFSYQSRNTPIREFIGSPPTSPGASSIPNSPVPLTSMCSPKLAHVSSQEVASKPPIYPSQPVYPAPVYKLSPSNSQSNLSQSPSLHQHHAGPPVQYPSPVTVSSATAHAFQPFNHSACPPIPHSPQPHMPSPVHASSPQNLRSASVSLLNSSHEEAIHPPKPSKTPPPSQTYGISPTQVNNCCATLPRGFSPPSARSFSYSEKSFNSTMSSPTTPNIDKKAMSGSKTDSELTDEEVDLERTGTMSRRHRSTSGSSLQHNRIAEIASPSRDTSPTKEKRSGTGLKKILGKLKRSASTHLHKEHKTADFTEQSYSQSLGFSRSTPLRSTAVARLNWSKDLRRLSGGDQDKTAIPADSNTPCTDSGVPFARWDNEQVACWLHDIGLNHYVSNCKSWAKNGETLLNASNKNMEQDLGIKNPLHRKKLLLALQAMNIGGGNAVVDEPSGRLDFNWVMRWLDDLGLPQYKDNFHEARVDGRVLNYLTVEDLVNLKVTNSLHLISLKRGIQVLREVNFAPDILKRRPEQGESKPPQPEDVQLWTNHRTMEWLRSCNLSEYAPNLRGSGVHGALIILESRFNADAMANLLSIPSSKTLLRRHLTLCFNTLVGQANLAIKRECESQPTFKPLTTTEKIKARRRSLTFAKKSKDQLDLDDFVCPMELGALHGGGRGLRPNGSVSSGACTMPANGSQVAIDLDNDKTAKQIGAFSREISTLTHSLLTSSNGKMYPVTDDQIFNEASPSTMV